MDGSTTIAGSAEHPALLPAADLDRLVRLFLRRGYRVVGPTVRNGAIVYAELDSADRLPWGWTDHQGPATYRLERREDGAAFGYAVGPHSWKRYLFEPERILWRGRVEENGRFEASEPEDDPPLTVFLGVRACELAAIRIQDRVFLEGPHADEAYRRRRARAFIIAANCTTSADTCFCISMDTGPQAHGGYDLALTEIIDADRHTFLVDAGTAAGAAIVEELALDSASAGDLRVAREAVAATAGGMKRSLETKDIRDLLLENLEHPNWDEIAKRCLACGNCTLVCPTCFCSDVIDATDLSGREMERRQVWDSCFSAGHSYVHGGTVHGSIVSRYRQWLTHKLATWVDQFGTSGCVGCGRCITWCPVGIDLTEEVPIFRTP